jgi:hypothetical protein
MVPSTHPQNMMEMIDLELSLACSAFFTHFSKKTLFAPGFSLIWGLSNLFQPVKEVIDLLMQDSCPAPLYKVGNPHRQPGVPFQEALHEICTLQIVYKPGK